jgi:hypothetical protein
MAQDTTSHLSPRTKLRCVAAALIILLSANMATMLVTRVASAAPSAVASLEAGTNIAGAAH